MECKVRVGENIEVEEKKVLDVAAYAGQILIQSGAEIFRVEETIERIAHAYGLKGENSFVLSSGIFLTEETSNHSIYANVRHIPLNSVNLERVAKVNQLSREISEGKYTIDEAMEHLERIDSEKDFGKLKQMLAYGVGSGSFCFLFGGSARDSFAAFFCDILLFWFLYVFRLRKQNTSKIVLNILSGAFVSLISIFLWKIHIGIDLDHIIIGSIMPLLPGVAFTSAIRDLANEDYISGTVRMVDAVLVAVCVAIGVGMVYSIYQRIPGGIL